jgi:hypothetical protein
MSNFRSGKKAGLVSEIMADFWPILADLTDFRLRILKEW